MSTTVSATPAQPGRRVRKRILIPVILLGLLVLVMVGFFVRGVWSDAAEKNPATVDQGTVTQLYRQPDGRPVVRCAIVIDAPPEAVWAVINDYPSHSTFLPYVSALSATPGPDGTTHLEGIAHSPLYGDWPFESSVSSKADPATGRFEAWWEESGGDFSRNGGRWELRPAGTGQTLVAFTLDVELKKYPSFLVRNVLMDRLFLVLKGLREEVRRRRA